MVQLTFDEICVLLEKRLGVSRDKSEKFSEWEFTAYIHEIFKAADDESRKDEFIAELQTEQREQM